MRVNFNLKQIAQIVAKLREYGELYVTTEGQMFRVLKGAEPAADAEEAVRTKNMIIEEADDFVGLVKLTSEQATNERVREFAKDVEKFNELFEKAYIPRSKNASKRKDTERKREQPSQESVDLQKEIEAMLETADAPKADAPKADAPKADAPKADAPKADAPKFKNPLK